jgi:hypothetical protein
MSNLCQGFLKYVHVVHHAYSHVLGRRETGLFPLCVCMLCVHSFTLACGLSGTIMSDRSFDVCGLSRIIMSDRSFGVCVRAWSHWCAFDYKHPALRTGALFEIFIPFCLLVRIISCCFLVLAELRSYS